MKRNSKAETRDRSKPEAAPSKDGELYVLKLYITGTTPSSSRAVVNVRKLCETYLSGRYELEVVDIRQKPERAKEQQLIAAPTLIKLFPLPIRRFIGDMSETERLIIGLELAR
jgi:circadian clock protein KaiB